MPVLLRNIYGHLLIAGLSLLFPVLLYRARHLDDNALTSWQWVFQAAEPWRLWLYLLLLTPLLWLLAKAPEWWREAGHSTPAGRQRRLMPLLARATTPLMAFLACLLFFDVPEMIVDAARYFIQAKSFSTYGPLYFYREWGGEIFAWTDLPLMSMLYGLLFTIFGESRLAAQLLNALLFALTTLLIAQLGRDFWDEETGQAGALLFLGFPYLYSQTPLLLVDIGTMFFLLLALASLHRAMTRGGWYVPLTAVAVIGVLLVKYSAWLLLSGLLPVFLCSLGPEPRRAIIRAALALTPALLLVAVFFWGQREVMAEQIALLLEFQRPALSQGWREGLISTFFFQTHPLLTAALLYSGYRAIRQRDRRYAALSWLVILVLVVLELRRIRYSIPILPLLALLAGYGLRDLADPGLRRHLLVVIAGSSLLLAGGAFKPFLNSTGDRNLLEAGRFLDTLPRQPIGVVVLSEHDPVLDPRVTLPLLDLFTNQKVVYLPPATPPPQPPGVTESPLRFSWEMHLPEFYLPAPAAPPPETVVVIKGSPTARIPPETIMMLDGYHHLQQFSADSGIFQYRPLVLIYRAADIAKPWPEP
ncbi:glycosyltransferase family 39 protein [Desulfurivibrio dismutans]|uniref:glycosyltransferase family 39 protein n=1 Tax=Desulfurivibrio dismutans TaxID=1398908 RepID=UPI0023DC72DF|nr:glycosyltransferase family 39 protein [Desulfurivibrio alkaliphilus]MDF1615480.1 glycosyltransferase family 39 protein [Desulfurivibrio alkaliphilus]